MLKTILKPYPDTQIALWDVQEDEAWFAQRMALPAAEQLVLQQTFAEKRHEWLASRYCLGQLSPEQSVDYFKDNLGKPHRAAAPFHISFSHTNRMAAAAISDRHLGIDIQLKVPKLVRIAHKFVGPHEASWCYPEHEAYDWQVQLIWSAKEAVYKAYGLKELPFIEGIKLDAPKAGFMTASVNKFNFAARYELGYLDLGEWMFVWAVQTERLI